MAKRRNTKQLTIGEVFLSLFMTWVLVLQVQLDARAKFDDYRANNDTRSIREEVVMDVPVIVRGGQEALTIKGLPQTVSVKVRGVEDVLDKVDLSRLYVSTNNLDGIPEGQTLIAYELVNQLDEDVIVDIMPTMTYVDVDILQ